MSFNYLVNTPLERAKEEYLRRLSDAGFGADTETIPTQESCGRISSAAVYAVCSAPHYPASAMDGIAVRASSTYGATETTPVTLGKDQFVQVDTGDPVPDGCDSVIMIEEVIWKADSVVLTAPAVPWQHIRQIGEDICEGEMILPSHARISPSAVGSLLAGGILNVNVLRKPVVGIIPTGDEVVPPTSLPKPGEVIEFNTSIFSAMLREWNAVPISYPVVPDAPELLISALRKALSECDIVLINAGSSAGRDDYASSSIREVGEVLFHGLSIRPGKPAILGCAGAKPVLGVPGYPVSGIIVIQEVLKPILDRWFCSVSPQPDTAPAILARSVVSGLKYEDFIRVRLGSVGGRLVASPISKGAGVVSSFMKADGIVRIPAHTEGLEAGASVNVELLKPLSVIRNTLIATGSHDPLLDELADLLHLNDPSLYMSSSHVGSMGGIMAVKRGETHIAGTHLLDSETGEYNISYIRRYFPDGGVRLVECVGRVQGIMTAKGNPLNLTGIRDLCRNGVRYVNRQKGAGTRVLFDYLLGKEGISPSDVYGYAREELTHFSVAVQIASGTADAGMGIYSAASVYGLDFIPICIEEYDLLIPEAAWDAPVVHKFLEILRSDAFRERAERLGGYVLENPGRVKLSV